jgi:glycerate kinase
MLATLGATPRDLLLGGGGAFAERSRNADDDPHGPGVSAALGVDLAPARRAIAGVELIAATDVDAPLLGDSGAAHGFGAQKGADRAARGLLENAMRTWAGATDGGLAVKPGTGAGGGIGFGLMLLGATRVPGAQLALDATRLVERARRADLLVTGEGAFDWQSLRGKVVAGVARTGLETGRPTVVLAGRVEVGRRELANAGIDAAYAVDDTPRRSPDHPDADRDAAQARRRDGGHGSECPAEELSALAERVARSWSR